MHRAAATPAHSGDLRALQPRLIRRLDLGLHLVLDDLFAGGLRDRGDGFLRSRLETLRRGRRGDR